jgi:hypothetical protein
MKGKRCMREENPNYGGIGVQIEIHKPEPIYCIECSKRLREVLASEGIL